MPNLNYSAQVWDSDQTKFVDVPFDINENKHFDNKGKLFSDYEIFIKSFIKPDDIRLIKVIAKAAPAKGEIIQKQSLA